MGNRFVLKISTWKPWDPSATHYYGRIKSGAYLLELEKRYATCTTLRFDTEVEVIGAAKAWFKVHGRPGDVLVYGKEIIMRTRGRRRGPRRKNLFRGPRKPRLPGMKRERAKKLRGLDLENF